MNKLREEYEEKIKKLETRRKELEEQVNRTEERVNKYLFEELKGEYIQIHHKNEKIKTYNNKGEEIKLNYPFIKLSNENYILEAQVKDNKVYIFDAFYFKEDLRNEPLFKRKEAINKLNYSSNIKQNKYYIVDEEKEAKKEARLLSNYSKVRINKLTQNMNKARNVLPKQELLLKQETTKVNELKPVFNKLENAELIHHCVNLVGSTIKKEKGHEPNDTDIQIRMNNPPSYLKRAIQTRLNKMLPEKNLHFIWGDAEGSHDSYAPLYNLALIKTPPEVIEMSKELQPGKLFKPMKSSAEKGKSLFFHKKDVLKYFKPLKKKLLVEEKFNGFHVIVHQKSEKITVQSEHEKKLNLPKPLITDLKKLSKNDYIIEGELIAYDEEGNNLGRAELMKYLQKRKEAIGEDLKIQVWDLLYYKDHSMEDIKLYERKKALNTLNWTNRVKKVESKVARSIEELEKYIENYAGKEGSEGAMIKKWGAVYNKNSETSAYVKYKIAQKIYAEVIKKLHEQDSTQVYKVGIPLKDGEFNKVKVSKVTKDNLLRLGNTFLTKVKANKGDVLEILVEQVWRHKNKDTGKIYYSIHKPRVIRVAGQEASNLDKLDKLVVSRGSEVIEQHELKEKAPKDEGGTRESAARKYWKNMWHKNYPKDGKGEWVYQHHFRGLTEEETELNDKELMDTGNSLHGDLRCSYDKSHAFGWTIFLGKAEENKKRDKLIKLSKSHNTKNKLRGHPKLNIPISWLDVGKRSPLIVEPSGPGATSKKYAKFFAKDFGKYEIGVWRKHYFELFLKGDKLDTRVNIAYVPIGNGKRVWMIHCPEDQTPYAQTHDKEEVKKELKEKNQDYLIWNNPEDRSNPERIKL